jgi:adenine-specific DNA-methyltransferase
MASHLERLRDVLKELFQLDQAELDFGIYRIMNAKRSEVTRFLDEDLLPQVRQVLATVQGADRQTLKAQLDEAVKLAQELGADPETMPKVKELRSRYDATADPAALEEQVFSHLASFFRRYYHEGDFISLRRYKPGVYAIPYEGEEVKLHWANADQYYIRTSETLRDYTFKLTEGRRVHFKVVAADDEKDNTKASDGQERRFTLAESDPLTEQEGELVIRFEHRPDPDKRKQAELLSLASRAILAAAQPEWAHALAAPRPTEKNPYRTLLDKHLADYTARNTFDYFIHKDLGGFLRRELDFYIKNEVMHLDDIEEATAPRVEGYLATVKAIRRIAHKIIDFLAQLEDFQKKLWLKKKFVVETSWCVTLDRVPESLYPEIVANDAQRREWVRLFAIDEIAGEMHKPTYSEPLAQGFLKANPSLVLDTAFFSRDFTRRLLASLDDLDTQTDGLLVHGENFQALRLLEERYRGEVQCIYIDPPYNTGQDGFPYKDRYQHSSWLSMLRDRLELGLFTLAEEGLLFMSVDDIEQHWLKALVLSDHGAGSWLGQFVWKSRRSEDTRAKTGLSADHEYVACLRATDGGALRGAAKDLGKFSNPDNDLRGDWRSADLTGLATRGRRPNLHYDLIDPATGINYGCPPKGWRFDPNTMTRKIQEGRVLFPDDPQGRPRHKLFVGEMRSLFKNLSSVITTVSTAAGTKELADLFPANPFAFPKPTALVSTFVAQAEESSTVLDFFAGSGTTGQSVLELNRADDAGRRFVLVEMAEHFDSVLKPRILKVIYSKDWKDGKPVSREGSSALVKVLRIESYEDTLNNLELRKTKGQQQLLHANPTLLEDYTLRYMLDVEGAGSLLDLDRLADPFAYTLKVATGSVGETREVAVDLVETFNYLLGLRVKHVDEIRGVTVVEGTSPAGDKVLVLWRRLANTDNPALAEWFTKQGYNTQDQEYDLVYVNGDNTLENLRRPDQTWKVRLIEEELHRLMFDTREV